MSISSAITREEFSKALAPHLVEVVKETYELGVQEELQDILEEFLNTVLNDHRVSIFWLPPETANLMEMWSKSGG